jgi:hypothetical protein
MINEPMTCEAVADQLASYLEGELAEPVRLELEAHGATCAACSSLLADLDAIRREASALPVLEPSRDLWSGIAARIESPVTSLEDARLARRGIQRTWLRPAIAAAVLVVATAGVTHYLTRASLQTSRAVAVSPSARVALTPSETQASEPTAQFEPSASEPASTAAASQRASSGTMNATSGASRSGSPVARLASAVPAMKATQPVYDQEIGKLRAIVKERRSQLDPKTIAVLEQSIAVIDSAIAQSRAALAKDPSSGFLASQLNQSLDKKVELLRTAALLPSRS